MRETPIWITDFMNAVYDGYGALALSSFNEEKALKDATEKIRDLERKLSESPAPAPSRVSEPDYKAMWEELQKRIPDLLIPSNLEEVDALIVAIEKSHNIEVT